MNAPDSRSPDRPEHGRPGRESDRVRAAIRVTVSETAGVPRQSEPVRVGVPLPRGLVSGPEEVTLRDERGMNLACQARRLAGWPDGSVQWLLVDVQVSLAAGQSRTLELRVGRPAPGDDPVDDSAQRPLKCFMRDGFVAVDTGAMKFSLPATGHAIVSQALLGPSTMLGDGGMRLRLLDETGQVRFGEIEHVFIEESGPIRASVVSEGRFRGIRRGEPMRFKARSIWMAGSTTARIEVLVHNPQAAAHPAGLWDLGDPGSRRFRDLSLQLATPGPCETLRWQAEPGQEGASAGDGPWTLYQDSSGGTCWDSPNHVDATGASTVAFRGYRVGRPGQGAAAPAAQGLRAMPYLAAHGEDGWVAVAVRDFWQNFPKALRREEGVLSVGLFPAEARALHELQGGEQKRQLLAVEFGRPDQTTALPAFLCPAEAAVDPAWVEASGAIPGFQSAVADPNAGYLAYVSHVIEGSDAFAERRERIDEYGWRNYGDLYADHEAVHHSGSRPLVSHYNNQYDFLLGACIHWLRTGDARWHALMVPAAWHVIDIDIYHTRNDRAAYNGGMFWHTDHYQDARTCTHRTYSAANGPTGLYGGGPSNEHNYTSGLLLYHLLSGDPEASAAVLGLADWVIAMDDGAGTVFALLDAGPTGLASRTVADDWHKPGRGAGNSVNALLDAHALSGRRHYLAKAEELLQRCIHPADDVPALQLDQPEHRWSYLVFLQVLGRYLGIKAALGELDYGFHHARESLLRYADWMAANEVPYRQILDRVELPTETW